MQARIRRAWAVSSGGRSQRLVGGLGAKLDDQKRAALGQQTHRSESLGARKVGQMLIEALKRLRMMLEYPRHLVGGDIDIVEAEHHQREPSRARNQPERRADRHAKRPFGTDQRAGQVVPALGQKLVKVVA